MIYHSTSVNSIFLFRALYKECPILGEKKNSTWSGLFGMLQSNEIDLNGAVRSMTPDRLEVGHFLTPYVELRLWLSNFYDIFLKIYKYSCSRTFL